MTKKKKSGLNARQKLFCEEYLKDFNGKAAAVRAGYSEKNAADTACELLKREEIAEIISKGLEKAAELAGASKGRVLAELCKIAFCDISEVIDLETGKIIAGKEKEASAAISAIKFKEIPSRDGSITVTEREIRLCDKTKALEMLGRYLKMFKDKVEVTGEGTKGIPVNIRFEGELEEWSE